MCLAFPVRSQAHLSSAGMLPRSVSPSPSAANKSLYPGWTPAFADVVAALRAAAQSTGADNIDAIRAASDAVVPKLMLTKGVTCEPLKHQEFPYGGEWFVPVAGPAEGCVLLYFHGGAFVPRTSKTHRVMLSTLAARTQVRPSAMSFHVPCSSPNNLRNPSCTPSPMPPALCTPLTFVSAPASSSFSCLCLAFAMVFGSQ